MLTAKQLYLPLLFCKFCSLIGILNFDIDVKSGRIRIQQKQWRVKVWKICLGGVLLRGTFSIWRLMTELIYDEAISPLELPLLIVHAFIHFTTSFALYKACLTAASVTCLCFNSVHEGHITKASLKTITLQEIVVLMNPLNGASFVCLYTGIVLYSRNAKFNLYSVISPAYQNAFTLGAVTLVDVIVVSFEVLSMFSIVAVTMLFLQKCIEEAQFYVKFLAFKKPRERSLNRIIRYVRQLQLQVMLHNQGYAFTHFVSKISVLSAFIVLVSFGIILEHEGDLHGYAYIFLGIDSSLIFTILFHKAFKLPILVNKIKSKVRNITRQNVNDEFERNVLLAHLRSFPPMSIRVGSFHSFEKMSTPNFYGYGIKQVIRILIAHRKRS